MCEGRVIIIKSDEVEVAAKMVQLGGGGEVNGVP